MIHLEEKNRNMDTLKYTIIKSEEQYTNYCDILEDLLLKEDSVFEDEIELLTLLIEKWDNEHYIIDEQDPVELIKSLMEANNLKAVDLVKILGLSKGTISKIMNYNKGLSKVTIRKLSEHFRVTQEAFNRPYNLVNKVSRQSRNAILMSTDQDLGSPKAM